MLVVSKGAKLSRGIVVDPTVVVVKVGACVAKGFAASVFAAPFALVAAICIVVFLEPRSGLAAVADGDGPSLVVPAKHSEPLQSVGCQSIVECPTCASIAQHPGQWPVEF